MKIRNRHLVRLAGRLGAAFARTLIRTQRVSLHSLGPDFSRDRPHLTDRFIFSIWHENLLLPAARYGAPDLAVLISAHADGQLLGGLIAAMGMEMVQGSSTRGGVEAVRQLVRSDVKWRHLAITTDGPRGPRRVVQAGAVYVASRTGMKIVPVGVAHRKPWRMKSWDRFAVPRPFAKAFIVTGAAVAVPPDLRSAALEEHRLIVQLEMDRMTAAAEAWAETGDLAIPPPGDSPQLKIAS